MTVATIAPVGFTWFDYQVEALQGAAAMPHPQRVLLHFKTGAGKSATALGMVRQWGLPGVLVIAPPATHEQWTDWGNRFGVGVVPISHAKFRQKTYQVSRTMPLIVDEFHLLGGHKGHGWKKLDRLARGLQAPLIMASATPNYNDAERVYCIQHVLDPGSCKGGYIQFLYDHCITEHNPFGREPKVVGFRNYHGEKAAAEYLAALPGVFYLEDDLEYQIQDVPVPATWPDEAERYGLNDRAGRIMASQMEERHARINLALVDDSGRLRAEIYDILHGLISSATTPSLVFAVHSTVADALGALLHEKKVTHAVVTGDTSAKQKLALIEKFKAGGLEVLVGTATLATGPDGLDKMCDNLIILDDTDDDSLRRQLIGRIMPRGADTDASGKSVYRLVLW